MCIWEWDLEDISWSDQQNKECFWMDQLHPGLHLWSSHSVISHMQKTISVLWSQELHRCLSWLLLLNWKMAGRFPRCCGERIMAVPPALRSRVAHRPYMAMQAIGGIQTGSPTDTLAKSQSCQLFLLTQQHPALRGTETKPLPEGSASEPERSWETEACLHVRYAVAEDVNWWSHYGKQYCSSSKN